MMGSLAPQDMTPPRNPFKGIYRRSKSGSQNYGQSSGTFSAERIEVLADSQILCPVN